jgi:ubiquitin C-terminal hydrolase
LFTFLFQTSFSPQLSQLSFLCPIRSLGGGHYTASARSSVDNKWYKFNDSSTSEMEPKAVNSGDVYLLFYVRRGAGGGGKGKEPVVAEAAIMDA